MTIELCRMHTLRVVRIDQQGVWLAAGERLAHLPAREAGDAAPDDQLDVFVYQDPEGELQATLRQPLAQVGEFALLTVRAINPHGAFLDWGLAKELLVPVRLQPERMRVGKSYLVKVCLDQQGRPFGNGRIGKCLDPGPPDVQEGDAVSLIVWQFTDLGAKVIVNHRFSGLLYRDELPAGLQSGDRLSGYVKRRREDGKLDVTLRKVGTEGIDEARGTILQALADHGGVLPLNDQSTPAAIKQALGLSKKSFKKAVGGLYKDGLVTLTDSDIRLAPPPAAAPARASKGAANKGRPGR